MFTFSATAISSAACSMKRAPTKRSRGSCDSIGTGWFGAGSIEPFAPVIESRASQAPCSLL